MANSLRKNMRGSKVIRAELGVSGLNANTHLPPLALIALFGGLVAVVVARGTGSLFNKNVFQGGKYRHRHGDSADYGESPV